MADVHYPDGVSGDPIKDLVTIAGKQYDGTLGLPTTARPLNGDTAICAITC
jgi:hypothetical protein